MKTRLSPLILVMLFTSIYTGKAAAVCDSCRPVYDYGGINNQISEAASDADIAEQAGDPNGVAEAEAQQEWLEQVRDSAWSCCSCDRQGEDWDPYGDILYETIFPTEE